MGPLKGRPAWDNVAEPELSGNHKAEKSHYAGGSKTTGEFAGSVKVLEEMPKNYENKMATAVLGQKSEVINGAGAQATTGGSPGDDMGMDAPGYIWGGRGVGGY